MSVATQSNGFIITKGYASSGRDQTHELSGGGIWCETSGVVSNCLVIQNVASSGYGRRGLWRDNLRKRHYSKQCHSRWRLLFKYIAQLHPWIQQNDCRKFAKWRWCCICNSDQLYGYWKPSIQWWRHGIKHLDRLRYQQQQLDFFGGGAYLDTLNNCILVGNSANCGGGASQSTLISCTISNNSGYGGGVNSCAVTNCVLANNQAQAGGGALGGMIDSSIIFGNSAPQGGGVYGGIINGLGTYPAILNNCIISNNTAVLGGGAFSSVSPNNCVFSNCIFIGNHATGSGGGAVACLLNNCVLTGNTATNGVGYGGGIEGRILNNCILFGNFARQGGGADGYQVYPPATLNNCTLSNNLASAGGAAAYCDLNNCLIISNSLNSLGSFGGGTYWSVVNNCLLVGNSATNINSHGSASYASTLNNSTVIENIAGLNGGAVFDGSINNSIIYYNIGGNYGQAAYPLALNYCCSTPLLTNGFGSIGNIYGFNNISNEPAFADLSGGDFHLQSNSPCINSGYNAYVVTNIDFDGNPRIVGGTVDIGAYEYQTPSSVLSYAWAQQYGLPTDGTADYADSDGDGMNNWQEWIAGTNPTNAASVLALYSPATTNTTGITVTWQSVNTRTYYLQSSTNLPAFTSIQSNIVGQAGSTSYTDTTATNGGPYFYRVGVQ